jgi:hypothetical protein
MYQGNEKGIQNFGLKSSTERPLGISRRRWEDNIEMYHRDIAY